MAGILALDIATRCGWAHLPARDADEALTAPVAYGTIYVGEEPGGPIPSQPQKLRRFMIAMDALIKQTKPMRIYMEQAHIGSDHRNTPELLFGLQGIAKALGAWHDNVRINSKTTPAEIKKFFTSYGWAKKDQMVARARLCGWKPRDDNEADALGLLCFATSKELKFDLMVHAIGQAQRREISTEPPKRDPDSYFRKPTASAP